MASRFLRVELDAQGHAREIYKSVVHKFLITDGDDPELYAAKPIYEWQQTDAGKFVMKHAINTPEFFHHLSASQYAYECAIVVEMEKSKLSEYYLKFGNP